MELQFRQMDPTVAPMHRQPRPLARQTRRQRAQAIEIEEKVWQLYITGRRQTAIAGQLNLSESRVSRYVARRLQRIEENAPCNPTKLAVMRELIAARLEATIEETYTDIEAKDAQTGEVQIIRGVSSAPMLAVRLKTLDQIAKLYGLNMQSQPNQENEKPYATPPEEIAARVSQCILALHGRSMCDPASLPTKL